MSEKMHTLEYGVHRIDYQLDEVFGLPAVCLSAITGPGLPNLRIMPLGTEPADGSGLIGSLGRIVFENGPEHSSRMAFPVFNPNAARRQDWKTKRRPPGDRGHSGLASPTPQEDPAKPHHSLQYRLAPICTRGHQFGGHYVVYHASMFPNEPTVIIKYMVGPGLPNLDITLDGIVLHETAGLEEGKGELNLHIKITREDLL